MFERARLEVRAGGERFSASVSGSGVFGCGPLEVELQERADGFSWSAVSTDGGVDVDAVSLAWDAAGAGDRVGVFSNGYQSWSRAGVGILGETQDPSRTENSIDLTRGIYHADPSVAPEGEVRSEMVTVIDPGTTGLFLCLGFEDGREHDGTFRVRQEAGRIAVKAEAFLGGARLAAGERRALSSVISAEGDSAPRLLEDWARRAGEVGGALTGARFQSGWCSWYYYFYEVSEQEILKNLALTDAWPFDVFQVDDGYQPHIGDWLVTNERFPGGIEALSSAISGAGRRPGIWIAPFLAAPGSALAKEHPEMLAIEARAEAPLVGMVNPNWGGLTYTLDTTRPETLEHLEHLASDLVAAGFGYLKLDFTYAPSLPGRYSDPSKTPAERVRAGLEAIRRGAGSDAFLLGCGCPLGPAVGLVDGMRIGPDVAPFWEPVPEQFFVPPGYDREVPATINAWRNTLARSFMHRRLWLNDPDCLMLRTEQTLMTHEAVRAWALAVAVSGGMALVSDDLSLLDRESRSLLDRKSVV